MTSLVVPAALAVLMVAGLVLALVMARRAEEQRAEGWRQVGAQMGFTYGEGNKEVEARIGSRLEGFWWGGNNRRTLERYLEGEAEGIRVTLADFDVPGGGQHRTLCILENAEMDLPQMLLIPEYPYLKMLLSMRGSVYGQMDLDFPEDPTFSEMWIVQGQDGEELGALLVPEAREVLREQREAFAGFIEGRGPVMAVFCMTEIPPGELTTILEASFNLMQIFAAASAPGGEE